MNKGLSATVISLTIMFIFSPVQICSAEPAINVEPSYVKVSPGENFTVNITVYPDGTEISGADYILNFNNNVLSALSQNQGPFLGGNIMANEIDNPNGSVDYGEYRIGSSGATINGILATITFNAMESGVCDLILDNVILSDPLGVEIPGVLVNDGTCKILAAENTPTSTPTSTAAPTATSKPSSPTPVTTATAVQTDTDKTPPLPMPHINETESTIPAQTRAHPSEENTPQSGFISAIAIIGMLIVLYVILRKK
jgi:hypothetical protein